MWCCLFAILNMAAAPLLSAFFFYQPASHSTSSSLSPSSCLSHHLCSERSIRAQMNGIYYSAGCARLLARSTTSRHPLPPHKVIDSKSSSKAAIHHERTPTQNYLRLLSCAPREGSVGWPKAAPSTRADGLWRRRRRRRQEWNNRNDAVFGEFSAVGKRERERERDRFDLNEIELKTVIMGFRLDQPRGTRTSEKKN